MNESLDPRADVGSVEWAISCLRNVEAQLNVDENLDDDLKRHLETLRTAYRRRLNIR